jgi:hypothetical protein
MDGRGQVLSRHAWHAEFETNLRRERQLAKALFGVDSRRPSAIW